MAEEYTIDDAFNDAVDHQRVAETQAALLDKAGTYTSEPELGITVKKNEETGRRTFTLFGMGTDERSGERARLRFMFSPDFVEKNGGPDFLSKNYAQAVGAYKFSFGTPPDTVGQVAEYLQKFAAKYRLIQVGVPTPSNPTPNGEPGTLIVGVTGIRP